MVTTHASAPRRFAASMGAAVAAGAVLAGGLLLGGPAIADGAEPSAGPGLPRALGAARDELMLADNFTLHGVPTRMSLFWTDDASDAVADHYERAWSAEGLLVKRHRADRVLAVSAVDSESGTMRSVSILDTGEDRLVLPNVSSVAQLPDFSPAGAPVPLPEGLKGFSAHRADEGSRATYVANFVVPLPPATVAVFYRQQLEAMQYTVEREMPSSMEGVRTLEAERGPERVIVSMTDTNEGRTAKEGTYVYVEHSRRFGEQE